MIWTTEWIGLPYEKGGRDRDGCDCYGLFMMLQKHRFDRDLHDYAQVSAPELQQQIAQRELSRWMRVTEAEEGDALFFRSPGHPLHIGYAIDASRMLHTENEAGSCIEYFRSLRLEASLSGIYRYGAVRSANH